MTSSSEFMALLAVTSNSPEEKVLRLLIELGAQFVGASEGSLLVYDSARNDLAFAMTVGGSSVLIGQRVPLNQGLTGLCAATREVQIGAPTFTGVKQATERADARGAPEAVLAAPMLVDDDLVGVITAVSFAEGKRFGSKDGELYARVASVAAVVVEQRRRLRDASGTGLAANPLQHRIAESVARISRSGPDALERTARILTEIEELSSSSGER